jgi:hypothetical protein
MSIWDDPELREGGEFAKLENKGDRISGLITAIRSHRFEDGKVVPQVLFVDDTTGDDRTWTAGQVQAKAKLAQLRPEAGDWFSAELADVEKRAGGKTLKHIEIVVNRGGKPAQTAPAATPAAAAAAPTADLSAVLAQLSPEQRNQLLAQQNSSPGF